MINTGHVKFYSEM